MVGKLQEYNFEIVHRKGLRHINADAMSRLPCHQCGLNEEVQQEEGSSVAVVQLSGLSAEEILNNQREDLDLKTIIEARLALLTQSLRQGNVLNRGDSCRCGTTYYYRKYIDRKHPSRVQYQLVVPPKLRSQVLKEIHEGAMGGHLGEEKTLQKLKDRFYRPGHWKSVQEWCHTCPACSQHKTPTPKNLAPLQSVTVSSPMQMVAIDILGPLPVTLAGNKFILVAADYFTKWIEAYAIPNQEATTVAHKLLDEMFCRFALPEKLHSEQGRQFEAEVTSAKPIAKSKTAEYESYNPTCENNPTCKNIPTCENNPTCKNIPTCENNPTCKNIPTCENNPTCKNIPSCENNPTTNSAGSTRTRIPPQPPQTTRTPSPHHTRKKYDIP